MADVPRRVVITTVAARHTRDRLRPLEQAGFELVERMDLDDTDDATRLGDALAGAWATIAGSEHYARGVFELAAGLRAIARWGIGYDAIDLAAADDHGVAVLTAPGANADAVADCALVLMLACVRRFRETDAAVRSGAWRVEALAADLACATVGIVGLGGVGKAVARRLRGFDCRLLAVEPSPDRAFCKQLNIELTTLERMLPQVDVITLHAPLTASTACLIGERELALLHPGAFLVNTSRGGTVDETALLGALKSGHLGGAGLDVFEDEPISSDHPLTQLDNVALSGHAASFTRLAVDRTADAVVSNLLAAGAGRLPSGCVNPGAWAGASGQL